MSPDPAIPSDLTLQLQAARERTLALCAHAGAAQLIGPRMRIVNPLLWEVGHLGWFQERWCLRHAGDMAALGPSLMPDADRLYDSSAVPHATRWLLPLPPLAETLRYVGSVLDRVVAKLESNASVDLRYFAQLCALHEEMHCEALTYTRQTLGYAPPVSTAGRVEHRSEPVGGDVEIRGGEYMMGAARDGGFVFDNEKWAHPVRVEPFRLARACVTNSEFAAFVDDDGYRRSELWSGEGWAWREAHAARQPVYWQRAAGSWCERRYDAWQPLHPRAPVVHVSWYEADAYCRWAGRRLPSEVEWEYAASTTPAGGKRRFPWGDDASDASRANLYPFADGPVEVDAFAAGDSAWGCRQMIGNVWEWTSDDFQPYPGFVADPYKEYSQPWFGSHKVLRGGCFATRASLIRNTWRNFYTPDRRDVYAGFRTCAA